MRPIRILMGKVGLDGHDRGAKVVMAALRDAGMEVIYSGLHQSPEAVVRAAIEEDADVIGLSILSGAHNDLIPLLMKELKEQKADEIPVIVGGIIPEHDFKELKSYGVQAIFTPGTRLDQIVESIQKISAGKASKKKVLVKKKTKKKVSRKKLSKKKSKK